MTVANTILEQLGGRRFLAMTGAKNLVGSETPDGLGFLGMRLPIGKAKAVRIVLTAMDDYRVHTFTRTGREIDVTEGVYAEDLQNVFANMTGLATRL